jgi:adenosylmethionine-8-amino-7-oxononanoate aminotransferase
MATVGVPPAVSGEQHGAAAPDDLHALASRHLWLHFTKMAAYADREVPVITRGEGCYVYDDHGKRYLDGLSALFCVNAGHGRVELAEAAYEQMKELAFFTNWSAAHPTSIRLAAKIAELAPGDLNRVFFTNGGSEAVDSALKLSRQFHKLTGNPLKTKTISRQTAYHGTTMGALSITGITAVRAPFEPLLPGGCHVPPTNLYRLPHGYTADDLAESIRDRILFEGPETVAAVFLEPVQNSGGCFVAPESYFPRVREICDEFGVLLVSDEVICSWGRIGTFFGCQRIGYQPDIITTAKGLTSSYAPMGAVIASDRVAEAFVQSGAMFSHGITFGGHPMAAAVALKNIEIFEREDLCGRVREHEGALEAMLRSLADLPIVGDVRGMGYFWAIELVKDRETKATFSAQESDELLRGYLSAELFDRGLICRADDRGEPVVQLSPPLVAGPEQFAEIEAILRPVLQEAGHRMGLS